MTKAVCKPSGWIRQCLIAIFVQPLWRNGREDELTTALRWGRLHWKVAYLRLLVRASTRRGWAGITNRGELSPVILPFKNCLPFWLRSLSLWFTLAALRSKYVITACVLSSYLRLLVLAFTPGKLSRHHHLKWQRHGRQLCANSLERFFQPFLYHA